MVMWPGEADDWSDFFFWIFWSQDLLCSSHLKKKKKRGGVNVTAVHSSGFIPNQFW